MPIRLIKPSRGHKRGKKQYFPKDAGKMAHTVGKKK